MVSRRFLGVVQRYGAVDEPWQGEVVGIGVMALAVGAEIYSNVVRYLGSGAGGVSPLLKLVLLLPFVWLLLESSKKIPLAEAARKGLSGRDPLPS
jgi:hypothetical protein